MEIQNLIDQALINEQQEYLKRERSGKWNPSSFGQCYRRQVWHRKNMKPSNPSDTRGLRVLKAGNLFHDYVQQFFPESDTEVLIETKDTKGYADIVREDEVIDIKSQHSRAFWYMEKSEFDVTTEKIGHILQLMWYVLELRKKQGRLIYISKDDLCSSEYKFYPKDWEWKVKKELVILNSYYDKNILPEAQPRLYPERKKNEEGKKEVVGFKECQWCQFKDMCDKKEGK